MINKLFYFSGTGNSLELARDIANGLDNTELVSIPSVLGKEKALDSVDTVGLVFPVYAWGVPRIVIDFVQQLRFAGNEYVFAAVTCGGQPAGTLPELASLLKTRGAVLQAGFAVIQPTNYILWQGAIPEEKQAKMFSTKTERLARIKDVVRGKRSAPLEQNSLLINYTLGLIHKMAYKHFPANDKGFWVTDNCNNCRQCERLCPRNNISLAGGSIKWQHNCEMCLACIQWCPKEAIQYKKATVNRKRYRHPGVKLHDLFLR